METWKPCSIFPEYSISDEGRVKNRLGKILRAGLVRRGK